MLRSSFRQVALLLLLFCSSGAAAQESSSTLRVRLMWYHQAQFAGFYIAEALGYYEQEGLTVELQEGGLGINPIASLASGESDVAMSWLPSAVAARAEGEAVVNFGQVFHHSGTMILCLREHGIGRPSDVAGKRVGVWNVGDELNLRYWLLQNGVAPSQVILFEQRANGADLIDGTADCVMAMTYNEYWHILRAGISPSQLLVVRLADDGLGFLEDGLYALEKDLADPVRRQALDGFLRATVAGWRYARQNPQEALTITLLRAPGLSASHQQSMLDAVVRLLGPDDRLGLLDLGAFERSVEVIASRGNADEVEAAAAEIWTHRLWYESGLGGDRFFHPSVATRYYLAKAANSQWFYLLSLTGTAAFAMSGFMRAMQRRYDLWGAFILAMMPSLAGGTLRDLLIAGERHPPFIFQDPTFIYVVLATFTIGLVVALVTHSHFIESPSFLRTKTLVDMVGMAAYAVVGAQVAIMAGLDWVWVPFCAALTCAGGGMLMDVITGREPRTFQGVPYEEIAVGGGLLMLIGLEIADRHEHQPWIVVATILASLAFVFLVRLWVVTRGVTSFRLGEPEAPVPPAQ